MSLFCFVALKVWTWSDWDLLSPLLELFPGHTGGGIARLRGSKAWFFCWAQAPTYNENRTSCSVCRFPFHPLYVAWFLNVFWLPSTNVTGQPFYRNLIQSFGAGTIYWNSPFFPASLSTASPFLCPLKQFGVIFQSKQLLCIVSFSNSELIIYYGMFQIKGEQYWWCQKNMKCNCQIHWRQQNGFCSS